METERQTRMGWQVSSEFGICGCIARIVVKGCLFLVLLRCWPIWAFDFRFSTLDFRAMGSVLSAALEFGLRNLEFGSV